MRKSGLVVLSGGQDSTTCLYMAIKKLGLDNVSAITFDYGQRHDVEVEAAIKVAEFAGIKAHHIVTVPNVLLSTSPLLSGNKPEQYDDYSTMVNKVGDKVENTFVPMRNLFFLTIAVNHAVSLGCDEVYIGVSAEDTANYPDCTEAFIKLFQNLCDRTLPQPVNICAPLLHMTKAQSIREVIKMGKNAYTALSLTHTSYAGEYPPVDKNHANLLRAKGFEEAGVPDPLVLRAVAEGLMDLPDTYNYSVGCLTYAEYILFGKG